MNMNMDLSLATTWELIDELKSRSVAFVVGIDPKVNQGTYTIIQSGGKLVVAGMIRALQLESDEHLQHDPRDRK